ncbi:unannotated protein [freshwater metagenome]|uniref:Unannotated protein n=1 Tax=freshwater metagenome TaxID=449393 RepID=A0A6J7NZ26_9ZZZZ
MALEDDDDRPVQQVDRVAEVAEERAESPAEHPAEHLGCADRAVDQDCGEQRHQREQPATDELIPRSDHEGDCDQPGERYRGEYVAPAQRHGPRDEALAVDNGQRHAHQDLAGPGVGAVVRAGHRHTGHERQHERHHDEQQYRAELGAPAPQPRRQPQQQRQHQVHLLLDTEAPVVHHHVGLLEQGRIAGALLQLEPVAESAGNGPQSVGRIQGCVPGGGFVGDDAGQHGPCRWQDAPPAATPIVDDGMAVDRAREETIGEQVAGDGEEHRHADVAAGDAEELRVEQQHEQHAERAQAIEVGESCARCFSHRSGRPAIRGGPHPRRASREAGR